ncbi:tRNA modification GTPase MnmE [Buchnera aphidicola (Eriosoma lanigerum)]|uniref:tRNA uridine-5-carboxymethylaminomethyl(34) synthesis GTPase MnmE n=1 Tax=Buchnera aphidicola TaxID=9 RepID=UPI00346393D6
MTFHDTIIAQATPVGKGGIGILRISGIHSEQVAQLILGKIPNPRYATFSSFKNENNIIIDEGIAIWFPGPNSFTGENTLELQGHGSPLVLDLLCKAILSIKGIRIANPGEFSERAFLNGKLDLIQAEAIADLINSNSKKSIQLSLESMKGVFSNRIHNLVTKIKNIRLKIESSINFIELETIQLSKDYIYKKLTSLYKDIVIIQKQAKTGIIIREGCKVVITGQPNVGKSSLFNLLCSQNKAIVTNIQGTTRDVLHEYININDVMFHLVDTAGIRIPKNEIEKIGIDLAWNEIYSANHILFVIDSNQNSHEKLKVYSNFIKILPKNIKISLIMNKVDLLNKRQKLLGIDSKYPILYISSLTGQGIEDLRKHLIQIIKSDQDNTEGLFLARRRHLIILNEINKLLLINKKNWLLSSNFELLAEDLFIIQKKLGEITGVFNNEKLLDEIFSNFCIGK